jgi:hypothetical protein
MPTFNEDTELQDFIPPKTNVFYAIDFDDCLMNAAVVEELKLIGEDILAALANNSYQETEAYFAARLNAIIKHNQTLLTEIHERLPLDKYRKFVTIFSNRQSSAIDSFNFRNKEDKDIVVGSCFRIFEALFPTSDLLRFIPILLTDYMNDLTPGTTFNCLTDPTYTGATYHCPLDKNKVLLAYEHAHFAATTYPKDKNIIKIYDDSCEFAQDDSDGMDDSIGILNQLAAYYEKKSNRDLLPSSVTLELYRYTGGKPILFKTITGTGVPDPNYGQTLRSWATCAREDWLKEKGKPIYADQVSGKRVLGFRSAASLTPGTAQTPASGAAQAPASGGAQAPNKFELNSPTIITTDATATGDLRRFSVFNVPPIPPGEPGFAGTLSAPSTARRNSSLSSAGSNGDLLPDAGDSGFTPYVKP